MPRPLRLLLLADTHLGLDLPASPRVERRRRGEDLFRNFTLALAPALRGEVDAVVHAGDLLFRSRVPAWLVQRAVEPLLQLARAGLPVFLVPGNHERSALPFPLLAAHPRLHLFTRPQSFPLLHDGVRLSIAGWPFVRDIGAAFDAAWAVARDPSADVRLLCLHQAIEGGVAGPSHYRFRAGPEVLAVRQLPRDVAAILSGHLHRQQVLTHEPGGRALGAPVLYPGSIERISFAERDEEKGALLVTLCFDGASPRLTWRRLPLPARPMHDLTVGSPAELPEALAALPADAIVRVQLRGTLLPASSDATLRALAPPTMNVAWRTTRGGDEGRAGGD